MRRKFRRWQNIFGFSKRYEANTLKRMDNFEINGENITYCEERLIGGAGKLDKYKFKVNLTRQRDEEELEKLDLDKRVASNWWVDCQIVSEHHNRETALNRLKKQVKAFLNESTL